MNLEKLRKNVASDGFVWYTEDEMRLKICHFAFFDFEFVEEWDLHFQQKK